MAIDYSQQIPNNVDLAGNRRLQRALEQWQPGFLRWWDQFGPLGFQTADVYLRTAISVDAEGWATFGYVKMPEYRWAFSWPKPKPAARLPSANTRGNRSGGRARRASWHAAPPYCHSGRYRTGVSRAAASSGGDRPIAL